MQNVIVMKVRLDEKENPVMGWRALESMVDKLYFVKRLGIKHISVRYIEKERTFYIPLALIPSQAEGQCLDLNSKIYCQLFDDFGCRLPEWFEVSSYISNE